MADLSSAAVVRESHPHEYDEIHTLEDRRLAGSLDFGIQTVEGNRTSGGCD